VCEDEDEDEESDEYKDEDESEDEDGDDEEGRERVGLMMLFCGVIFLLLRFTAIKIRKRKNEVKTGKKGITKREID
jgi:hypothetical protein